jgi:iron complex outermembrane receptor protein
MRTNDSSPWWLKGATLAISVCASGVRAESPADEGPRDVLEEIIITADKKDSFGADYVQAGTFRNARVMDTPLTITILPRTLLDAQQASSIGDALKDSAGVSYSQTNPAVTSNISIRGIPVDNRANYRMNGGLPIVNLIDLPLEDKDRVEVLKGVSSLYYGFTTPSGVVNVVMKRPTADPLLALSVTGNQYGSYGGAVDASHRFINDTLGVRVNAAGGQIDTGVDRVLGHRALGAVAIDWNPIDALTVRLDAEYIQKKMTETPIIQVNLTKGVTVAGQKLPALPDPTHNLGAQWMTANAHEQNAMGHIEWRMTNHWSIMAEAGRSHELRDRNLGIFTNYNLATGNGLSATVPPLGIRLAPGTTYENQSYRAELAGAFRTGPLEHQLSLGSSYNLRIQNNVRQSIVNVAQNLYNPVDFAPIPEPTVLKVSKAPIHDKGLYAFDKVSYSTWVDVLLGFRHTNYESQTIVFAPASTSTYAVKNNSKSGGIVFKPDPRLSTYVTYLEGLEEGGTAPLAALNNGTILPAGITKQKEVGVKGKPIDSLLLALSYFDIERPSAFTNAANIYVQDGRTTYKGLDFSATGEIGSQVSLLLNLMTETSRIDNTSNPLSLGARPENTPKFTAAEFAENRPSIPGLGILGLTAGVVFVGNRPIDNVSGPNTLFIGGYTTYDIGARYSFPLSGSLMNARLKVENLTNKRYWSGTGTDYLAEGLPRTLKFEFDVSL